MSRNTIYQPNYLNMLSEYDISEIEKRNGVRFWTKHEDDVLLKNFPNYLFIICYMPDRTKEQILERYEYVKRRYGDRLWTKLEINILKEKYPDATKLELLSLLPRRTYSAIRAKAVLLDIKRFKLWPDQAVDLRVRRRFSGEVGLRIGAAE